LVRDIAASGFIARSPAWPLDANEQFLAEGPETYKSIEDAIGVDFCSRCIKLNDSLECDFNKIADYIEGKQSFQFFVSRWKNGAVADAAEAA
jgi:hypothetical protein